MTGQKLSWKTHENVYLEEPVFIRARQGHSGNNLDVSTFSHRRIEKGYDPLQYHIGFSRYDDSLNKKSGELVPGGFGMSSGRKTVYF